MKQGNLILITLDEVRPDHLGCYGYHRIRTRSIDRVAAEGVLFETAIASSNFTPICHASLLTGMHPPAHGLRDPFSVIQAKTLADILRDRGYKTAGFVGHGILDAKHGFGAGFDLFDEPRVGDESWETHRYPGEEREHGFLHGNWWMPRMLDWIKENHSSSFFAWGHFFHTHEGSEHYLMARGLMEEGELSEFSYYDAKVKLADQIVIGPLLKLLEELNIYEDTTLVVASDHGTTLGEHPADRIPWRDGIIYPQHTTMYDVDLRVALVMKGTGLPGNKRVKGMVRQIDVVPTLVDYMGISTIHQFDGISLRPFVESEVASGLVAYAEELYEKRGPGDFQAVRTDRYKYIVDRRHDNTEEFYDLESDPGEQTNIIDIVDEDEQLLLKQARELTDSFLGVRTAKPSLSEEEKEKIEWRLRRLGYIQ